MQPNGSKWKFMINWNLEERSKISTKV